MRLLIDGDILAYRSAAACDGRQYIVRYLADGSIISIVERYKKDADAIAESLRKEGHEPTVVLEYEPEPVENAKFLLKKSIESLETECKKHFGLEDLDMSFYLSRGGSFREQEFPTYKANRKDMRRPKHLEAMKDYLTDTYGAECRPGEYEADDMMAFTQGTDTCICSIDKDLLQVPGLHYNFVKKKFTTVTEKEGLKALYMQMLTGDATDGIPGLKGIGPKTAAKIINPCSSEFVMYCAVQNNYYDKMPREDEESEDDFKLRVVQTVRAYARLLYLLRTEEDSWEAPEQEA